MFMKHMQCSEVRRHRYNTVCGIAGSCNWGYLGDMPQEKHMHTNLDLQFNLTDCAF